MLLRLDSVLMYGWMVVNASTLDVMKNCLKSSIAFVNSASAYMNEDEKEYLLRKRWDVVDQNPHGQQDPPNEIEHQVHDCANESAAAGPDPCSRAHDHLGDAVDKHD